MAEGEDVIDITRFQRNRPALFRSPEEMAALRAAQAVGAHIAATGQPLVAGPALRDLCGAVPARAADPTEWDDIPEPDPVVVPFDTRPGGVTYCPVEVMPERPHRSGGWVVLGLMLMVAVVFGSGIFLR